MADTPTYWLEHYATQARHVAREVKQRALFHRDHYRPRGGPYTMVDCDLDTVCRELREAVADIEAAISARAARRVAA